MTTSARPRPQATLPDVVQVYVGHTGNIFWMCVTFVMIAWFASRGPGWRHLGWSLLGFLAFMPQEQLVHRYILHFPPPKNRTLYRWLYRAHYGHHDCPKRVDLMWIPNWLTLPLLLANIFIGSIFFKDSLVLWGFVCGTFVSYLVFEWWHLLCHVPYPLNSRWFSLMRQRHLWHHLRNEKHWYTVQHLAWPFDVLGGTAGCPQTVPASYTVCDLGVSDTDPRVQAARAHFAARTTGDEKCSGIWLE